MKLRQRVYPSPRGNPCRSGCVQVRISDYDQYGRLLPVGQGGTTSSFMVKETTVAECSDFICNALLEQERRAILDRKGEV